MRNTFKIFIIPIIIAIISGSYAFWINRQVVDVRYTLSENIPINISNQSQSVQQLVVKNLGNSKAEKIVVNIQGKITDYELIKYSEVDSEQSFNKNDRLQIIYPELPPEGSFKITIKADGKGLSSADVKISHNKGEATEALSSTNNKSSFVFIIFVVLGYIIVFGSYMWLSLVEALQRKAISIIHYEKILKKRNSPLYISNDYWVKLRKDALETMVRVNSKNYYYLEFEECGYYKILSNEKLEYLTENEWLSLCKSLGEMLEVGVNNNISKNLLTVEFIRILKLPKPKQFDDDKWREIRKRIMDRIISKLREDNNIYFPIEELDSYKLLNEDIPNYLSTNEWNDFSKNLMEALESIILQKVSYKLYGDYRSSAFKDLLSYLRTKRPQQFKEARWKSLMETILNKYVLLKKEEFIKSYSIYLESTKIAEEFEIEKAEEIPKEYWNEYIKFVKELFNLNIMYNLYKDKNPVNYFNKHLVDYTKYVDIDKTKVYSVQLINYYIESFDKEYEQFIKCEKPDWIKNGDYNKILEYLKLSNQLKFLIDENKKNEILITEEKGKLESEKRKIEELKNKITYQLDIINDMLLNPKAIERIESYNDVFAKGNFENLKKIAILLTKEKMNTL
ncbi:hypothetical protein [Clostridium beijerinckii]|uniref:hypothetical protein n=1 Tax=Clostridium beijerinckii TaxID=1520 RepID=UPI00098BE81A|nr:hypothetical protein [Clostridium beijerinckii]MBA8936459.1 hypothetical protein [Clostridium beijerinckii]NRU41073.1 hypothetical protein [Clostridium beijerinckii]NSA95652.1 hypothetical protein [Clostridium beijerinckii]OOM67065.1 hypothetical protein CLOBI_04170 [Clostridium beijerinckii]OOM70529.1 hypothetical protein CLBEIC_19520 [Clostridium beijerinckii]